MVITVELEGQGVEKRSVVCAKILLLGYNTGCMQRNFMVFVVSVTVFVVFVTVFVPFVTVFGVFITVFVEFVAVFVIPPFGACLMNDVVGQDTE
jgi:hypothetical protein